MTITGISVMVQIMMENHIRDPVVMAVVTVHNSVEHLVCGFCCVLRKICLCFIAMIYS